MYDNVILAHLSICVCESINTKTSVETMQSHLQKNLHRDRKPRLREKGGKGNLYPRRLGSYFETSKKMDKIWQNPGLHMVLILLASGKWHTTLSKRIKCSKWPAKLKTCETSRSSDRLLGIFVWTNVNKGNIISCVESHDAKSMSEFLAETSSFQGNKNMNTINKYPLTRSKRVQNAWTILRRGRSHAGVSRWRQR